MLKPCLTVSLLFLSYLNRAQDSSFFFYYPTDKSTITVKDQQRLSKLLPTIFEKVVISGFTDSVGTKLYNQHLSQRRAEEVGKYITLSNKQILGKGEHPDYSLALHNARCVKVELWKKVKVAAPITVEDTVKIKPAVDCTADTILRYPSGTVIQLNKCYYLQIKHCFNFTDYTNVQQLQDNNLITEDESGNSLESGGMFKVGGCGDSCFKFPITIRILITKCPPPGQMFLYNQLQNGLWRDQKVKVDRVKIGEKEYYSVTIKCPGFYNFDKPKGKKRSIKFKLRNGMKFQSAMLGADCPFRNQRAYIKRNKRKVLFDYFCPNCNPVFSAVIIDKNGDTLRVVKQNPNDCKHKRRFNKKCKCQPRVKEKTGIGLRVKKKYIYRKYIIYREDLGK